MKYSFQLFFYLTVLIVCISLTTFGQIYTGPIPKPTNGYGSDGNYTIAVQSFSNTNYPSEDIKIYYPSEITSSVPTLFYSHGHGGSNPLHVNGLLNFFAKKGYAIVFVPYQTTGVSVNERYVNLLEGFRKAGRDYPTIIDTTRVGFLGHSFGGGATIGISYKCFTENNWGQNGRFICPSAQWYSFNITQTELQSFPLDTKMLTFVYDSDTVNDFRMAGEVFSNINIPNSEKDFIRVLPSTITGYDYTAGHNMPTTYAAFDALDYYAYYRLIEALCDYTFNGSLTGKDVALGNGSVNQITMPAGMTNVFQTDTPVAVYPESIYSFPCSVLANPREAYCNTVLTAIEFPLNQKAVVLIPNPGNNVLNIESQYVISQIEFYNVQGKLVQTSNTKYCAIGELPNGVYFIKVILHDNSLLTVKWIKK